MGKRKLGFYHYSPKSNKRLVGLFEKNQKIRYSKTLKDWGDKRFTKELEKEERQARKEIFKMLRRGEIRTSDDFYRAANFFHHGSNFRHYALAVALFAISNHLGDLWGKNAYAVALDRFLLSIKQPQYFVTQFEKRRGKWLISPYKKGVSDKERKKYYAESLARTRERVKEMNKEDQ